MILPRPGHVLLPDGELLRLDYEFGPNHQLRYVASEYLPDHTERRHVRGDLEQVTGWLDTWAREVL